MSRQYNRKSSRGPRAQQGQVQMRDHVLSLCAVNRMILALPDGPPNEEWRDENIDGYELHLPPGDGVRNQVFKCPVRTNGKMATKEDLRRRDFVRWVAYSNRREFRSAMSP